MEFLRDPIALNPEAGDGTRLLWTSLSLASCEYGVDAGKRSREFSRIMEVYGRGLGYPLLSPHRIISPNVPVGDVGIFFNGAFKPLWNSYEYGPKRFGNYLGDICVSFPPGSDEIYQEKIDVRSRVLVNSPRLWKARVPNPEKPGKEVFARLGVSPDSEVQLIFCRPDRGLLEHMCSMYPWWQGLQGIIREADVFEDLPLEAPIEYIMYTGGVHVRHWRACIGDLNVGAPDYIGKSRPDMVGFEADLMSIECVRQPHPDSRGTIFMRFNKCLSRSLYKKRGRLAKVWY